MTHVHTGRAYILVTLSLMQNIDIIEQKPDSHLKWNGSKWYESGDFRNHFERVKYKQVLSQLNCMFIRSRLFTEHPI